MIEERYEDCDRCGERYHGEFIDTYLRDEERLADELWRVCCEGDTKKDTTQARGYSMKKKTQPIGEY